MIFIFSIEFFFLIGTRDCTGQYNGGYPCLGASIESQSCATNITCPSK